VELDGVCDEGVCDEGVCDDGVCGEDDGGVCARATLAESTRLLVHSPLLIIRVIDIDPPNRLVITWLPHRPNTAGGADVNRSIQVQGMGHVVKRWERLS
jgi:hypothetical protein